MERSIVSPSGNEFVVALERSPENEFLIVDQVNDLSVLVRHANSAVLLDDFSFDQTGRIVSLVGRPWSGMNGSEIYVIDLDNLDYRTIGNGELNFANPLVIGESPSGKETLFSYVSSSTIPITQHSREKILNFDPVTWIPVIVIDDEVEFLTEEFTFTSDKREAQLKGLKLYSIVSFYFEGHPFLLVSAWLYTDYKDNSPSVIRLNNIASSDRSVFLEKSNLQMQLKNRFDPGSIELDLTVDKEVCISRSVYTRPYPYEDFSDAE